MRLDRFGLKSNFRHQPRDINLAAINADASDNCHGFRQNPVTRTGDVVAARSAHIADARNYGYSLFAHMAERRPNLVGGYRGASRRRNANNQRLGPRRGQLAERFQNGAFHTRIDCPVDIQERDRCTAAPALVENPLVRRTPGTERRLRIIDTEEGLKRIGRNLIEVKQRIDEARALCRRCRH